ncbi:MAG TPA: hypothetical protein VFL57_12435 [Bryobacteraceae bacterium]|nr:hypothetical protein [Bryobacteraceae bacterium]
MATAEPAVTRLEERSGGAAPARGPLVYRLLVPSLCDIFFITIICWRFLLGEGWTILLMDGDTGWHIRAGEWMLEHARIPTADLFSFSRPGAPWFAWEWLTDVAFAALHGWAGLKGVVLVSGLVIAAWTTVLLRHAMWRGANAFAALGLAMAAFTAASMHFHARPHITTLLLVAITAWVLDRDRRQHTRAVWALVPLAGLWTNLHGGWLVLIVLVGLTAAGTAIESWLTGDRWMGAPLRYLLLLGLCSLATLANPYGPALHGHIFRYLREDWIRKVVGEFQAPSFRGEAMASFELLLIAGLISIVPLLRARRVTECLWLIFFAHAALTSARHVTVYVTLAVPVLAAAASQGWRRWIETRPLHSAPRILEGIAHDLAPGLGRISGATALFVVILIAGDGAWLKWPVDFPAEFFPTRIVAEHATRLANSRVLTKDQWADYLIYRSWPRQKVFFDGRSDFYGQQLWTAYDDMATGRSNWREQMTRHGINLVLAPARWPLATLLKEAGWNALADDGTAVLLAPPRVAYSANTTDSGTRISGVIPTPFGAETRNASLMKKSLSAESTRREPAA